MKLSFESTMFEWRGPAPYYFIEIPAAQSTKIKSIARELTWGWGVIPVTGEIGGTKFTTALFPKNGNYLLPIKKAVRDKEKLEVSSTVRVKLTVGN
ncbi:MAG: DUF1905 domain-containing protein [Actinomycetota bacterium]